MKNMKTKEIFALAIQNHQKNNLEVAEKLYKEILNIDPNHFKSIFYEVLQPNTSVAFSPDGIHWTKYAGNPVRKDPTDLHNLLGWDDRYGKYVAYIRPDLSRTDNIRTVGRSVSEDFINWTESEIVLPASVRTIPSCPHPPASSNVPKVVPKVTPKWSPKWVPQIAENEPKPFVFLVFSLIWPPQRGAILGSLLVPFSGTPFPQGRHFSTPSLHFTI